ncbi:hypothetical protein [Bdellovibrio sp. HCB209]|uniref:hypothetical protein n=1 Tax=Bdellovibrio sp. HCB209 TaxID=3394354 RepID=UPI0039B4A2D5
MAKGSPGLGVSLKCRIAGDIFGDFNVQLVLYRGQSGVGEVFMSNENDRKMSTEFDSILELMTIDVPSENRESFQDCAIEEVRVFCENYGIQNAIQYFKQKVQNIGPVEWQFFAMAGFNEVEAELRSFMNSEDQNKLGDAAIGLAFLGHQDGFDVILSLIKNCTSKPPKEIRDVGPFDFTPVGPVHKAWELDWIKPYLYRMKDPRAEAILRDYAYFFKKSF